MENEKQFIKIMEGLDYSKSTAEKFNDFCTLAYSSLAKTAATSEERAEKLESRYMEVVGRYNNKDDIRAMPELLGMVMRAMHQGGTDFLGSIAGEIGALNGKTGQFFTPFHISKMCALVNFTDQTRQIIEERGFISVSEPAAGAGSMMLALADVLQENGYNLSEAMIVQATDLSQLAFHMCYIQLFLKGIPASVVWGNTLSMEVFESAWTGATYHFYSKHNCLFPDSESWTNEPVIIPPPQKIIGQQFSLFEE